MAYRIPKEMHIFCCQRETTFSSGDMQFDFTIPEKLMFLETAGRQDRKRVREDKKN